MNFWKDKSFWKDGFGRSIVLTFIFLGSFFSGWTVFTLILAGFQCCWQFIGQTDSWMNYIGGWQFVVGAFVIGAVVFFKICDYLLIIKTSYFGVN